MGQTLGWVGIIRLGLVQTALGAIVVLTTSTLNRVMVVEHALPAMLPGALVALHYVVQLSRPRWGYGSDIGGRRTPWILGGMAVLAIGGFAASVATAWMETNTAAGIALAVVAFTAIGGGVGAAGTSLLALLATSVDERRRPAAAAIVWIMMIFGFVLTAGIVGGYLDPFSSARLMTISLIVSVLAFGVAVLAVWGVEAPSVLPSEAQTALPEHSRDSGTAFRTALKEVWEEPKARRFTIFVFVSMLAYSAQDLILEPFAGAVFGMTPGESTRLAGVQHGGVLLGMILVGLAGSTLGGRTLGSMRLWVVGGCCGSSLALLALAFGGLIGSSYPLQLNVFVLGFANGVFAVAAIGSMMNLAGTGRESREGTRMGLWGAAQAMAFGLGGFLGAAAIDFTRMIFASVETAYAAVFAAEGLLFLTSALLAVYVTRDQHFQSIRNPRQAFSDGLLHEVYSVKGERIG